MMNKWVGILGLFLAMGFGFSVGQTVVKVAGDQVTLNAGSAQGVKTGMTAYVLVTEEAGGRKADLKIAKLRVTTVNDRTAVAQIVNKSPGYTVVPGQRVAFTEKLVPPEKAAASPPRETARPAAPPSAAPDAGSPGANLRKGEECLERGEYEKAKQYFGYVRRDIPDDPKAFSGMTAAEEGIRNAQAEKDRLEKRAKELTIVPYYQEQGDASLAAGDFATALYYYGQILALEPDDASIRDKMAAVRIRQGDASASRGDCAAAWGFYTDAAKLDPSQDGLREKIADLMEQHITRLAEAERMTEAAEWGQQASKVFPDDPGWIEIVCISFERLGDRLAREREDDLALNAYQVAQSLDPARRGIDVKIKQLVPGRLTNTLGMTFVYIRPGEFPMGSTQGGQDERPVHTVSITTGYYLQETEVSQQQWEAVMGAGSAPAFYSDPRNPVVYVSWKDVAAFIARLNTRGEGTYRLPTEAEWEYACRAGQTTPYPWGTLMDSDYCWFQGNAQMGPHPGGQKRENPWGIHDMTGNVWEWCSDYYSPDYYAVSPRSDPTGPATGQYRVLRGGSWTNMAQHLTSSVRYKATEDTHESNIGFRLVRER